jgi:hypothetical protein
MYKCLKRGIFMSNVHDSPKEITKKKGVGARGQGHILEEPDGIPIQAAPEDTIETACGFLSGDFSLTRDLLEEHRKDRGHESTRGRR